MASNKDSFIETLGVIIGLAGLTCLLVGAIAFPVAGSWKNSVSIATLPIGAIFLIGSAFIKPRLPAVLLLPAGIVGISIGLLGMNKLPENTSTTPYWIPVIAGGVFIVASLIFNIPALSRSASRRRGLVGANVFLLCLMGLVVLVGINYMASLYYSKRDLTKTGRFTLAPRTLDIVKSLPEPVEVTFVMQPGDFISDFAKNMIEEYATISKNKLSVKYIDPVNDPEKALKFFAELKLDNSDRRYRIVFRTPHAFKQVMYDQLLEETNPMAAYYGQQEDPKFKGETEFTAALIKVTDTKKPTIYFTTGKGEVPLDAASGSREPSMAMMKKFIENDNYELKTINLANEKRIPQDCDILAIVRPKYTFSTMEVDLISDYLRNHGKLFVGLKPAIGKMEPSGLEKLLEEWGIRVRNEVVVINIDRSILFGTGLEIFADLPKNEITEKIQGTSAMFYASCIVEPVEPPRGPQGQPPVPSMWQTGSIAMSCKDSWGETEITKSDKVTYDPGKDIQGPVSIAAYSKENDPNTPPPNPYGPPPNPDPNFNGARIIVVGDSDFATDSAIGQNKANVDFALNDINWLAKKTAQLGISAKPMLADAITIKPEEMQAVFYSTLFGLPYLALMIGGIVYWRRSK